MQVLTDERTDVDVDLEKDVPCNARRTHCDNPAVAVVINQCPCRNYSTICEVHLPQIINYLTETPWTTCSRCHKLVHTLKVARI